MSPRLHTPHILSGNAALLQGVSRAVASPPTFKQLKSSHEMRKNPSPHFFSYWKEGRKRLQAWIIFTNSANKLRHKGFFFCIHFLSFPWKEIVLFAFSPLSFPLRQQGPGILTEVSCFILLTESQCLPGKLSHHQSDRAQEFVITTKNVGKVIFHFYWM